jgi:hypothetical protein
MSARAVCRPAASTAARPSFSHDLDATAFLGTGGDCFGHVSISDSLSLR